MTEAILSQIVKVRRPDSFEAAPQIKRRNMFPLRPHPPPLSMLTRERELPMRLLPFYRPFFSTRQMQAWERSNGLNGALEHTAWWGLIARSAACKHLAA